MKPEKRISEEKPEKFVELSRDQLIDEIMKAKTVPLLPYIEPDPTGPKIRRAEP